MDSELQARIAIEKTIRNAVINNSFVLHYQPVYRNDRHHLIGFEALVRCLPAEDGTLIPPLTSFPSPRICG